MYRGAGVGSASVLILENLIEKESGLETALKILGAAAWEVLLPASYFLKAQAQAGRGCAVSPVQCEDFSLMQANTFSTA